MDHTTLSREKKSPTQSQNHEELAIIMSSSRLEELPVECKRLVWRFFGFQELCRAAQVSSKLQRGVDTRFLWRKRALELLRDEQQQMGKRTGLLGHRLQRGFATRDLLATGEAPSVSIQVEEDENVADDIDWKRWYQDTFQVRKLFFPLCQLFLFMMELLLMKVVLNDRA